MIGIWPLRVAIKAEKIGPSGKSVGWMTKRAGRSQKCRYILPAGCYDDLLDGEQDATAAGSIYSNRDVGGFGAIDGADRGLSRCRLCHDRSALSGIDLLRDDVRFGHADGPRQDTASSRRLLCLLRGQPWRCGGSRSAAADFCQSATPVPADIVAGSYRDDTGVSCRLEHAGARASRFFLT